jgi:hypothetical protein
MSARVVVRSLVETEYPLWNRLVAASPDGSPYATPEYLDALCGAAGGGYRILGVFRGEELIGGLPLYERTSRAGRYVGPRLLLYYLSPVLRSLETRYPSQRTSRQVEALGALAEALGEYDQVQLKCRHTIGDVRPFLVRGWAAQPSYSYLVQIGDLSAAWARVEQNLRRLVDRCAGQGVVFAEDDDFASFYELHRRTLDRKDAAVYLPEAAFRSLFVRLRALGACRLYHARLPDGRPIAAQLVLTGAHPVSHTVSAAADPDYLATGVNAFLRWRSFEALSALGFTGNDLTDAALNPVTHFKSQLGGDLVTCFVLSSPASRRWRLATGVSTTLVSLRGMAAKAARGLLRRTE